MKRRGVILLEAVFALMLLGMITYGFAATQAMAFSQASALKDSDKARQYADLEAEIIKAGDFETFGTTTGVHGRKSMQPITGKNDGYESAVSLVQTVAVSEDNTVKIANIDVYKTGEITPRFSLEVPLSSQAGAPEDGSAELDNKLIIKYGTYHHSHGEYAQVFSFPSPFPHACVAIAGSPDTYNNELNWSIIKRDRTSFYMYMDNGGNYSFSWIAIGY